MAGGRCQKDPTEVQNEAPTHPDCAGPLSSRHPLRHKRRETREKGPICVCNRRGPPRQVGSWRARQALGCWFGGEGLSQGCISNLIPPMHVVSASFSPPLLGGDANAGWVRKLSELEKMQSTGLTPHIVVVVVHLRVRVEVRHLISGWARHPTSSPTVNRAVKVTLEMRAAEKGCTWWVGRGAVGRGKEGEAWRGRILWGTPRLGAVPSPDQCPGDLGDGARGLTVLASGRDRCGVPRNAFDTGVFAHQLMRHGVRWVVVGCGRTPCEEPQLSWGMMLTTTTRRGAWSLSVSRHAEDLRARGLGRHLPRSCLRGRLRVDALDGVQVGDRWEDPH